MRSPSLGLDHTTLLSLVSMAIVRLEREASKETKEEAMRGVVDAWMELMTNAMDLLHRHVDCACFIDEQDDGLFNDRASWFVRCVGLDRCELNKEDPSSRMSSKMFMSPRRVPVSIAEKVLTEIFRRAVPLPGRELALFALAASEYTRTRTLRRCALGGATRLEEFSIWLHEFGANDFWLRWLTDRQRPSALVAPDAKAGGA